MAHLATRRQSSNVVIVMLIGTEQGTHAEVAGVKSVNTLASDASGPSSTPGQGTLEDDSSFYPIRVGILSTSFGWEGGAYSGKEVVLIDQQS